MHSQYLQVLERILVRSATDLLFYRWSNLLMNGRRFLAPLKSVSLQAIMENQEARVVIQLSNDSAEVQKAVLAQIHNLMNGLPGVSIELVIHSHGINLVFKNSHWQHKLEEIERAGVRLLVCRNTMNSMNLRPEDMLSFVTIIPSAVVYLVEQQQKGWSYLKAGF